MTRFSWVQKTTSTVSSRCWQVPLTLLPRLRGTLRSPAALHSPRSLSNSSTAALNTLTAAVCEELNVASWDGLRSWRSSPVDERRYWGQEGPTSEQVAPLDEGYDGLSQPVHRSLAEAARKVLLTADAAQKAALTHSAWQAYKLGRLPLGTAQAPDQPARPAKPQVVHPKKIPTQKKSKLPMNAYMLHNLAHIELNAIDLALDTVARFSGLGLDEAFYSDFARVADDESRHLGWCLQRLAELGYSYGDMPAHNLLWEGAQLSAGQLEARLSIVPLSQEARGLDAGPRLTERLMGWGDHRTAAIVERIAEEEKAHVAVGVEWLQCVCAQRGQDPGACFKGWVTGLAPDLLKGPFNHDARIEVGLLREWYDTELWPEEERARAQAASQEFIARRSREAEEGGSVAQPGGAAEGEGQAPSAQALESVQRRLAEMLQMEGTSVQL